MKKVVSILRNIAKIKQKYNSECIPLKNNLERQTFHTSSAWVFVFNNFVKACIIKKICR